MSVLQDLRVTELLASRICHDLISPVNAVNNGVELMEEMGEAVGSEAFKLIGHSAEHAARRLSLFRVCYGSAGADSNLSCGDVLNTARVYFTGTRVQLEWTPLNLKDLKEPPPGFAKVLLNMVLIAHENMVHGGTIAVVARADRNQLVITASGRAAGQRTEALAPLRGETPVAELTPRSIHPHVTGRFAAQYGIALEWAQPDEDTLHLTLGYAAAENGPIAVSAE